MATHSKNILNERIQIKNADLCVQRFIKEFHGSLPICSNEDIVVISEVDSSGKKNGVSVTFCSYQEPKYAEPRYISSIMMYKDDQPNGESYDQDSRGSLTRISVWENGQVTKSCKRGEEEFSHYRFNVDGIEVGDYVELSEKKAQERFEQANHILNGCLTCDPLTVKKRLPQKGNFFNVLKNKILGSRG